MLMTILCIALALLQPYLIYAKIDRQRVVSQFNVIRTSLIDNETTPLQVGNGNFAFNVDNTGMQARLTKVTRRLGR
ncbi:hypothetical protein NX059_007705 [Plenodomus lindquistii]|nr:hypothetical protein NX059_007705 [Plenodomus lindquistii]